MENAGAVFFHITCNSDPINVVKKITNLSIKLKFTGSLDT